LPAEQVEKRQLELLAAALAMAKGPAREFLLYGERMPTPRLDVPEVKIPVWIQSAGKAEERTFPAVAQALWRLRDGRMGWVAVNVSGEAVKVTVPLRGGEPVRLEAGAAIFREK